MDSEIRKLCRLVIEGDRDALEMLGRMILRKGDLNIGKPNGWIVSFNENFWDGENWGTDPKIFGSIKKAEALLTQRSFFHNGNEDDFKITPIKYFHLPTIPSGEYPLQTRRRVAPAVHGTTHFDNEGNPISPSWPNPDEELTEEDVALMEEFGMMGDIDPWEALEGAEELPLIDLSEDIPDPVEVPVIDFQRPGD